MKAMNREMAFLIAHKGWGHFMAAAHWWVSELLAIIPDNIKQRIVGKQAVTFINVGHSDVAVEQVNAQDAIEIRREPLAGLDNASLPPVKGAALVTIAPEDVLIGQLKIPAAAQTKLRQVLSFELERRNPFRTKEILFDFFVTGHNAHDNTLEINWALVPVDVAHKAQRVARRLGYHPEAVGLKSDAGHKLRYVFARQRRPVSVRFGRAVAVLVCSLLFFGGALGYIAAEKTQKTNALLQSMDALKIEAEKALKIKTRVEKQAAALAVLSDKIKEPGIADIMLETTQALPDDTWVFSFDVNGKELRLKGTSVAASPLIEKLAAVPIFAEPRFNAAITLKPAFGEKQASEQFDIAVTIKGRTATKGEAE